MIVYDVDNITEQSDPPTKEVIERDRQRQVEALRAIRRMLTESVLLVR
jgi:hypothetical protein